MILRGLFFRLTLRAVRLNKRRLFRLGMRLRCRIIFSFWSREVSVSTVTSSKELCSVFVARLRPKAVAGGLFLF